MVGCVFAGGAAGTKTLSDTETGAGQSKTADERIEAAGLRDPAVESVLIKSGDPATTAAAAADLTKRLKAGDDVSSVQGPAGAPELSTNGGRIVLVQSRLRGDPDDAGDVADGVAATVRPRAPRTPTSTTCRPVTVVRVHHRPGRHRRPPARRDDLAAVTLLVLVIAFGALVAASVPLVLGITAVTAAMGALGVVSQIAPSTDTTASVVVLIGLAVGVDYSLFYIRREREERRAGRGPDAALDAAAASVGRAILISGLTVMIALGGLLLSGNGVFISIGLATMLVVAIAVLGSLTVLPAMLALLGDRIDKGRLPRFLRRRPRPAGSGFWAALARLVTRRPVAALVVSVSILAALAVPALQLKTGDAGLESLPADIPVVQAEKAIQQAFPGAPSSASLVVTGKGLDGQRDASRRSVSAARRPSAAAAPCTSRWRRTAAPRSSTSRCRPRARTPTATRSTCCATRWRRPRPAATRS